MIAEKLRVSSQQFLKKYTDPRWPGNENFLIRHKKGACIFLERNPSTGQSLCSIHVIKPACCREWQAGLQKRECREGLKTYWGLEADSAGNLYGTPEKLAEFQLFLKSLPDFSF